MFSLTIEFFSTYSPTDAEVFDVPACNRMEKEFYPNLDEDQVELILAGWSDNLDILDAWIASGKGEMHKVIEDTGKWKFIAQVIKK